ncbi:MAG TPA: hypothetical protein VNG51_07095 [Ktedonobacteraceae bacterium]|nr:hypothetical protein [Ktedonobacteraceae bacterium]
MRSRSKIFLSVVSTVVLAMFMTWTVPAAAAQGQHACAVQSLVAPNCKTWKVVNSPSPGSNFNMLNGVAALSGRDVWAVGNYYKANKPQPTLIEHWNGTKWSVVKSPNPGAGYNILNGVTAISATDIWAVGYYTRDDGADQTLTELYS